MRRVLAAMTLVTSMVAPLGAQDFTGTFAIQGGSVPITLVLQQDAQGRVSGSLTGQTAFQVQAQLQGQMFVGVAANQSGRLYLAGQFDGAGNLTLVMAELDATGQPQTSTARQFTAQRSGGTPGVAAAAPKQQAQQPTAQQSAAPGPSARGPGRGQATAADPWVGAFAGSEMTLTLQRQGAGYGGSATYQGAQYQLQGQVQGNVMSGIYVADGVQYPFQAQLDGDAMQLAAGNQVFAMQRRSSTAGEGAPGMGAPGMGAPGNGVAGAAPQDTQLAQLLMRSAWCSFSYSSAGGASGSSHTERVTFRGDGTGFRQTGGESYYSGPSGSVAGQGGNGTAFRWRVQGGQLVVTDASGQSSVVPLQVTQNSNGYPIITASGTEYSMCN